MKNLKSLKCMFAMFAMLFGWLSATAAVNYIEQKPLTQVVKTPYGPVQETGGVQLLKLITGQELVQNALRFDVLGKPVTRPDRRRGVVFQNYTLLPNLTVLENVMLGMKFQAGFFESMTKKWKRQAASIALHYLKEMRILEAKFKYPSELSGGMRQRVAIAQALVTINMFGTPDILCMDEPFGALDPGTREDMQVLLLELWEKYKKTVIFVTHDLEEAVFLSTRLIVLSQFWTSDAPEEENTGARIVMDIPIDTRAMSANVKKTAEFAALVQQVRNTGFNPEFRRHVDEFNESLRHPDSFQSLTV